MSKSKDKVPAKRATSGPRNEAEAAAVDRYHAKWQGNVAPSFKQSKIKGDIEIDHPDPNTGLILLAEAIGGPHPDFVGSLLKQLKIGAMDEQLRINVDRVNFALSVIKGVEPRDTIEVMIAAQMATIHQQVLDATRRLGLSTKREDREAETRAVAKLGRAFVQLIEGLKRHRGPVEQRVVVQHIHVNDGGKAVAIVEAPGSGTGGRGEIDGRSHATGSLAAPATSAALLSSLEEDGTAVPGGSDEGQTSVPDARGPRRRSAG